MHNQTKELTIIRYFDAPRALVWAAWTNEDHIRNWWAPTGFTNPVCHWDAAPGKDILIHMRAPDGTIYPMDGRFLEVDPQNQIVFISRALNDKGGHHFNVRNTVTFTDEGNGTKVVLHLLFTNVTEEGMTYLAGAETGWNLSLNKLVALLAQMA